MIIVTLGDPLSCNVELLASVLKSQQPIEPIVFVGSHAHWTFQMSKLNLISPKINSVQSEIDENWQPGFYFVDLGIATNSKDARELSDLERGALSFGALECFKKYCQTKSSLEDVKLLTAPIEKKSTSLAGLGDHGHTEYLAKIFNCETVMILAGPKLRVALVTNHLALKDVATKISSDLIVRKALILAQTLKEQFAMSRPKIAVTGLNPHCGDSGMFGNEEIEIIQPAVENLQANHGDMADFSGVHPADTVFFRTMEGQFDCVLAMYHDQALGPLKTVHFDTAINVTGGLPIKRVSPDHGPAANLFLQSKASPKSFENAFQFLK